MSGPGRRGVQALAVLATALAATAVAAPGSAEATKLCKAAPPPGNPLICPAGEGYAGESLEAGLESKTYATFKRLKGGISAGEVKCTESKVTAKFKENGLSPQTGGIETAEFGEGGKPSCPTTFFGKPEVEMTIVNPPYHAAVINYIGAAAPQGELIVPNNFELKVRVLAESEFSCFYRSKEAAAIFAEIHNATASTDAKLKFKAVLFELVNGGMLCPTEAEFTATYDLKRTNPNGKIYITDS